MSVLDSPQADWRQQGRARFKKGDRSGAIQCFLKAIEDNPRAAGAWCDLGDVLCSQNEHQGALLAYNNAAHIDTKMTRAIQGRQRVQQQIDQAVAVLQQHNTLDHISEMDFDSLMAHTHRAGPNGHSNDSPNSTPHGLMNAGQAARRQFFIQRFSWAVPNQTAIDTICEFVGSDTILEVGSGLGLWASLLQLRGASVIATDDFSTHHPSHVSKTPVDTFTFVERLSHRQALDKYAFSPILMLCWPPFEHPMSHETVARFTGDRLVYIGESGNSRDGITGSHSFHKLLSDLWVANQEIAIPTWPGLQDRIQLYHRR